MLGICDAQKMLGNEAELRGGDGENSSVINLKRRLGNISSIAQLFLSRQRIGRCELEYCLLCENT